MPPVILYKTLIACQVKGGPRMHQRNGAATWNDVWELRREAQDLLVAVRKNPRNQRRVRVAEQKLQQVAKARTPGSAVSCLRAAMSILAHTAGKPQQPDPHRKSNALAPCSTQGPDTGPINWSTAERLLRTAETTFEAERTALNQEDRERARGALDRASSALHSRSAKPCQIVNDLYRFHSIIGRARRPDGRWPAPE